MPTFDLLQTTWSPGRRPLFGAAAVVVAFASAVAASLVLPATGQAKTPEVLIVPEQTLHFGTFMVFGSGSRTVSAGGAVVDSSIVALEGTTPNPARFAVSYDRGNESNHVLDIELELVISNPARVRDGGVEGMVSALQTDLPGATQVSTTQPIRIFLRNCRSRVCTLRFQVGGRLDIIRYFGGADLAIPIPLDARVVSVERQR